jgi:hypothetical protein
MEAPKIHDNIKERLSEAYEAHDIASLIQEDKQGDMDTYTLE